MSAGRRKCACCSRLYRLDTDGLFPSHYHRGWAFAGERKLCPGSEQTPESAKAIADGKGS